MAIRLDAFLRPISSRLGKTSLGLLLGSALAGTLALAAGVGLFADEGRMILNYVANRQPPSLAPLDAQSLEGIPIWHPDDSEDRINQPTMYSPYRGLDHPRVSPAQEARVEDDEEVIGVMVGDKARAYRIKVMEGPRRHIVNDVINGVPISITFCDITMCARAFTSDSTHKTLDLDTGGFHDHQMVLLIDGRLYYQKTGKAVPANAFKMQGYEPPDDKTVPFPFAEYPIVRSSWKAWKVAHPNTDIYWINWNA